MAYYIHNIPGRLRIKSPVIKNNTNKANELKKIISSTCGIIAIDINLVTGSLLINYNHKTINHNDIVNILQKNGYFNASMALTNDQCVHNIASKALNLLLIFI
jgi:copper chaperone CopZ